MKILQVVHGYPPEFNGGTETYTKALGKALVERGHTCRVLAGSEQGASEATLVTVDEDGLPVTRYLRAKGRPRRWTEEYDAEAEDQTRRLLALVRPDVVHLHQWLRLTNNLVAICADSGIPVVVTLHDVWTSCPRIHRIRRDGAFCPDPPAVAPCLTCAERATWQGDREIMSALALRREVIGVELALAKAIIVPSEAHRAFLLNLLELPENRLTVLPHGSFPPVAARQGRGEGVRFPHRPLQIGHWGYQVYLKGPHLILEAVHQLRDPSAVQVHLIGTILDQGYEQRLRELARGIPVQFHGAYQPADLPAFDLDIAVLPSIASESYSFALDEALGLGLPALVADRGALPERIGAAGLTFQAGDSEDLAVQIQGLLDAPETFEKMRRNIRSETFFSMDAHIALLEKIYNDAIRADGVKRESKTPYRELLAHLQGQMREREESLTDLQERLTGVEHAYEEIEALFHKTVHEKGAILNQAAHEKAVFLDQVAHKDMLLDQAGQERQLILGELDILRREDERLRREHERLSADLHTLRQTTLFKIHEMLTKLLDLLESLLSKGRQKVFGSEVPAKEQRPSLRPSEYLKLLRSLLGKGRHKMFSRAGLSPRNWRVWLRRCSEEYAKLLDARRGDTAVRDADALTPYDVHIQNNRVTPWVRTVLSCAARNFQYQPVISILMPVYNVQPKWLKLAVDSIKCQIYPHWELCIADDASSDPELLAYLRRLARDRRVKVVFRPTNGNISAASNSAAGLAIGEFVVLMDNDDVLAPNALFEIARLLQEHPDADLIYSDEDKIDEHEHRYDPQFKPDWSPEMLLAYNYINHLTCIRRDLFEQVGRFRIGYEGSQDYDMILRVVSRADRIHHIAKVLYHWRALPTSIASAAAIKPVVHASGRAALEDHLRRLGIAAKPYVPDFARRLRLPINQLDWPDTGPSVVIIIPTANQDTLLKKCVESILSNTTYVNYRILVVDNESDDPKTLEYLKELPNKGVRVERISNDGRSFSFSRVNNQAVQLVDDELVLFLNNDTEVIEPKWLSRLVGYVSLPGVGATGARLLFGHGTLQHAGVVLGLQNGVAPGHAFFDHPADAVSYYFQAEIARPCAAVTGACLLTGRRLFLELGGFDEKHYAVSMNDVDYCLRLAQRGLRTVYVGGAELFHHESRTRSRRDDPAELAHFREVYRHARDIYYNPNLSNVETYQIDTGCHLDYEPYLDRPVRALMVTHNMNLEGASKSLYELAAGLKTGGRVRPTILSPVGGIGEKWYRDVGINVRLQELPNCRNVLEGWLSKADYQESIKRVMRVIEEEQPDVIIANTLNGFYVVEAATRAGIPSIWIIRESYTQAQMRHSISTFALADCERAFVDAYRVVFVSTDTMRLYRQYETSHNFVVVHNGLDASRIDEFIGQIGKAEAARIIQAPAGKKIVTTVGTICERKRQRTLAEAAAILRRQRDDFVCYMVGLREGIPHAEEVRRIIRDNRLEDVVRLIPETDEVRPFLRAADIFAFTSHIEAFSRTILEAEAFGLPIITTPCCGVHEQVRAEVNALLFEMSDARLLAQHIATLLDDDDRRIWMGGNSRKVFDYLQNYNEMLERYGRLVFGAWMRGPLQS